MQNLKTGRYVNVKKGTQREEITFVGFLPCKHIA